MTQWSDIIASGRGRVAYRLMIEGWPHEFVTDTRITHATYTDGRIVYGGLLCEGLQIHDRVIMHEAKIQASGNTFKIRPTHGNSYQGTDPIMASLSRYPEPTDYLGASLTSGGTVLTPKTAPYLTDGTVYYLGTETIRAGLAGDVTRAIWDSLPQAHNVDSLNRARDIPIFTYPPSMEGRRCYLYAYSGGASSTEFAGHGTCVWRGIVARPPRLSADGVTWEIQAQPITHVLRQEIGAVIREAHPIGIFHNDSCAVYLAMRYDGDDQVETYLSFHALNEAEMLSTINDSLAVLLVSSGADATIEYARMQKTADGYQIVVSANSTAASFGVTVFSLIFGSGESDKIGWTEESVIDTLVFRNNGVDDLLTAGEWAFPIDTTDRHERFPFDQPFDGSAPYSPLGPARMNATDHGKFVNPTPTTETATNRVYVDEDFSTAIGDYVHINVYRSQYGTKFKILDAGTTVAGKHWIDLALPNGPADPGQKLPSRFMGFLDSSTTINLIRAYGFGHVGDFISGLKAEASVGGNDGDSPFITSADVSDWDATIGTGESSLVGLITQQNRMFRFKTKKPLEDILPAELLYANLYMRIESDGRIGVAALPAYTEAIAVDAAHTVDASSVVTPFDAHGAWPRWEPQRDGRITTVSIQVVYDDLEDTWKDEPALFQEPVAIAIAKGRGKTEAKIRPYSRYFNPAPFLGELDFADEGEIAARYLAAFSRDYVTVTVRVPFSKFSIVTGDVCKLSHALIPNGSGARGMVQRLCVCIERRWNLDPSRPDAGELTFLVPTSPAYGYAPSAQITAQTNTGGNNWDITCDVASATNIAFSRSGSGQCLENFAYDDYIRVVRRDVDPPVVVTGRITSVPNAAAGTCSVALNSTWTTGGNLWVLEFDVATTGHTTSQDRFVYVADSTLLLANGSLARRYS